MRELLADFLQRFNEETLSILDMKLDVAVATFVKDL